MIGIKICWGRSNTPTIHLMENKNQLGEVREVLVPRIHVINKSGQTVYFERESISVDVEMLILIFFKLTESICSNNKDPSHCC